jgi:hypothetical protein
MRPGPQSAYYLKRESDPEEEIAVKKGRWKREGKRRVYLCAQTKR